MFNGGNPDSYYPEKESSVDELKLREINDFTYYPDPTFPIITTTEKEPRMLLENGLEK